MIKHIALICFIALVYSTSAISAISATPTTLATVYLSSESSTPKLSIGIADPNGAAFGSFDDGLLTTGWGVLRIQTNNSFSDATQMKAAGFLEGALTASRIFDHYQNIYAMFFEGDISNTSSTKIYRDWFAEQDFWTRSMIQQHASRDSFWKQISNIIAQFDGLVAGYNAVATPSTQLDLFAFQTLNGNGDLLDLISALNPASIPNWDKMSNDELRISLALRGHCSAFIKVAPAFEDLFISHSSWFEFGATNRIFKHYNFQLNDASTAATQVSFSSYPAYLSSLDDFYMMNSGLVMVQTTNNIFNADLYKLVHPQSLLAWHRVRAANLMAHNGAEWSEIVARYNSGTYNNQYMVVTLDRIRLNEVIEDGALWVVEQVPGYVESRDLSEILRTGYFASYNVPFFEKIYNMSGYPSIVEKRGTDYSYQLAPRAKIFRRDAYTVTDFNSLKHLMRYNEYKTDPYSENDPANSICSRIDLESHNASPGGCYDTKATTYARALKLQADAINGPTAQDQPPFSWSQFPQVSHVGLPQTYNFDFVTMDPAW